MNTHGVSLPQAGRETLLTREHSQTQRGPKEPAKGMRNMDGARTSCGGWDRDETACLPARPLLALAPPARYRAKHRLVLGFAALFRGYRGGRDSRHADAQQFRVVSPTYAPQVRNGRYQKGRQRQLCGRRTRPPRTPPPINEVRPPEQLRSCAADLYRAWRRHLTL